MDVIVKSLLHFIQGIDGLEKTIIAGGAVRDNMLGLTPNDYDFCVPSKNNTDMTMLAGQVANQFKIPSNYMVCKTKEYTHKSNNGQKLTQVWNFKLEGRDIDLIGNLEEADETFATKVVEKFDYGINMVYYDGNEVITENMHFKQDLDFSTMTLVNLDSLANLPNAMKRFLNLNSRLEEAGMPTLTFRTRCFTMNRPEKKQPSLKTYSGAMLDLPVLTTAAPGILAPVAWAAPAIPQPMPVNDLDANF